MDYQRIITLETGKRGGRPCVRGLRIAVFDILGWLGSGMTHEQILSDHPELIEEDIRTCLATSALPPRVFADFGRYGDAAP